MKQQSKHKTICACFCAILLSFMNSYAQGIELWGMTNSGGTYANGVIFSYNTSTNSYNTKFNFDGNNGAIPKGSLIQANDGMLYAMTFAGGTYSLGTLFQYNPTTSSYTKLIDFDGVTNGANPNGSLIQANDGNLYGMTSSGGANNVGVLFQYNPTTLNYTKLIDFDGATNGATPNGSLIQANDGKLYGATSVGGLNNLGVIFQFDINTTTYTKKYDFNGTNGGNCNGSLSEATDGTLYGVAFTGGLNNSGAIFQFDQSTSIYTEKYDYSSSGLLNASSASLQSANGKLYGICNGTFAVGGGGTPWNQNPPSIVGKLFSCTPSGATTTNEQTLNDVLFDASIMGASDGMMYGMSATNTGNNPTWLPNPAVLYKFDPTTQTYQTLMTFDPINGTGGIYGTVSNNLIELSSTVTSIKNSAHNANIISVYPNPFTTQTKIVFAEEQKNTTIKIVDVLGKEIKHLNVNTKEIIIDRDGLTEGVYFIQVISNNKTVANKKIIVQ